MWQITATKDGETRTKRFIDRARAKRISMRALDAGWDVRLETKRVDIFVVENDGSILEIAKGVLTIEASRFLALWIKRDELSGVFVWPSGVELPERFQMVDGVEAEQDREPFELVTQS
jgi:hypothetical protein